MDEPNKVEQESRETSLHTDTTPPSSLGVYDRPERTRLTLPVIMALILLALITIVIIWQLWL